MKLTAKAAPDFCRAPPENIWAALFFCDDEGVAADAARSLAATWSEETESERRILTEDEIAKDPALLFDSLDARSLLGGRSIIEIRLSGERLSRTILDVIEAGDRANAVMDNRMVIIAGSLKKSSRIRKQFEDARNAAAVQLYSDTSSDTKTLVTQALETAGIDITQDALADFTSGLPGHRRLAHAELEKLALYAHGLDRPVSIDDIRALSANDVDHKIFALVDAAFSGEGSRSLQELDRLELAGTSAITILRAIQRDAQRMLSAKSAGSGNVGMKLRPPVYPQQWPGFQKRMRKWSDRALLRLLERIHDCERTARLSGPTADPALRILVTDMARLAARS